MPSQCARCIFAYDIFFYSIVKYIQIICLSLHHSKGSDIRKSERLRYYPA